MVSRKSQRTEYVCENCDATFPKWQGECYHCGTWNSLIARNLNTSKSNSKHRWVKEDIEEDIEEEKQDKNGSVKFLYII